MEELLRSPPITLTIGPEQSHTTVQATLFRGISEPLNHLLSSVATGHAETNTINEYLQHDDKDAFLQLVSLAYGIILKGDHDSLTAFPAIAETTSRGIVKSSTGASPTEKSLVKCPSCKKAQVYVTVGCESCNNADCIGLKAFLEIQLAQSHESISKQSALKSLQTSPVTLDTKDKATGKVYLLIHFAKVFHLAAKYEVPSLQISALKAFERRLKKYSALVQKDVDELLDVLRYLASRSRMGSEMSFVSSSNTDEGTLSSTPGVETSALLKSLMRYVVAHVGELLQEEEFQEIVAEHGAIGLELMKVLQETIVASEGS